MNTNRADYKPSALHEPRSNMAKRRWNLWVADNQCYYCKSELAWEETTIEHIYSRVKTGKRELPEDDMGYKRGKRVLSCAPCNQKQARKEWLKIPREMRWIRCGRYPRLFRKDLTMHERIVIFKYRWLKMKPNAIAGRISYGHTKKQRAWVSSKSYPKLSREDLTWQDKLFIIKHKVFA